MTVCQEKDHILLNVVKLGFLYKEKQRKKSQIEDSNVNDNDALILIEYCNTLYQVSIVGSVVECSPATRAARVRFPDDAIPFCYIQFTFQVP
jgi:hypothetical protein